MVLSGDAADALPGFVAKRGFEDLAIGHGSPETWDHFGVKNPKRERLPHPTTLVVAPDGTVLFKEIHENFRGRSDPGRALAAIAKWKAGEAVTTELSATPTPPSTDWDTALKATLVREGDTLSLVLEVASGFHVYGSKEQTSLPIYLGLAQRGPKAKVPEGEKKLWEGGESWVLEGRQVLTVPAPAADPVEGMVGWQLCTDSTCSAPRNHAFALKPGESATLP